MAEIGGAMLLKAAANIRPGFEAAGAESWANAWPGGKPIQMSYGTIPGEPAHDPDAAPRAPAKVRR